MGKQVELSFGHASPPDRRHTAHVSRGCTRYQQALHRRCGRKRDCRLLPWPGAARYLSAMPSPVLTTPSGQPSEPAESLVPRLGTLTLGWLPLTLLILGVLAVFRIAVLVLADYTLGPDEAQYWAWSTEPAFGYYSKPPMVAWIIAATTSVFGDAEWAVRLGAPLIHTGTALLLYVLGQDLYDRRIGFWSAVVYATGPAVWFSSGLITTDVPLLFFAALALVAFNRALRRRSLGWAALFGAAVGLGLLSKYTMLYLPASAFLFLVLSRDDRWMLWSRHGILAAAVTLVLLAPNLVWNLRHGLSTLDHTADNFNWGADLFNPDKLLAFVGAQFGVFGPLLFAFLLGGLLFGLVTMRSRRPGRADLFLLCFVLPLLAVVMAQALLVRAHANWAAPVYVAATVLVVAWAARIPRAWPVIPVSVGLHTLLGLVLATALLWPNLAEAVGRGGDFRQVRGWDTIGAAVMEAAAAGHDGRPYAVVLTDHRMLHASLLYYARPMPQPLRIWHPGGTPTDHFQLTTPFRGEGGGPVLLVTPYTNNDSGVLGRFDRVEALSEVTVPTGGRRSFTVRLFALDGYRPSTP
ncbi:MAG: glycosyltransferase family 39 protein [Rhodospirillales bacterium]|nr:MAG: glycosyltransferase family 39 protein [Rhodospirillales bacterium]